MLRPNNSSRMLHFSYVRSQVRRHLEALGWLVVRPVGGPFDLVAMPSRRSSLPDGVTLIKTAWLGIAIEASTNAHLELDELADVVSAHGGAACIVRASGGEWRLERP